MLKIKDNVDLKELEKYGFYLANMYGQPAYVKDLDFNDTLAVIIGTKTIYLDADDYENYVEYLLEASDELIKADLVEKVEDK